MRLAFVVGDPRALRASHTTAHLALAAVRRGHDVGFVGVDDLTLTPANRVAATVRRPGGSPSTTAAICEAMATAAGRDETIEDWDAVFLRVNPHRESGGEGSPVVDFGWRLRLGGALVINDPEGAQRASGRMYVAGLPADIRPRTLVTREPAEVKRFLRALDAAALIKPLSERNAPAGRFYVGRGQLKNLNQMIAVVRKSGYLVVQEYLSDAAQGETRLLLLGGEPLRSGGRVAIYRRAGDVTDLPAEDHPAATRRPWELGARERRIAELLRPRLLADGLHFVGVDLAGGKVLEVNVHTPGGAQACAELYGLDVGEVVVRDLERRVAERRANRARPEA
jgi:glutathione synthase